MAARRKGRIWTVVAAIGVAIAVAAAACLVALFVLHGKAASPEPAPNAQDTQESRWPEVDWGYWQEVNPDVVGWISIPGTSISQPVVQASASSPDWYLSHDVYGNWNPWGAIFIDADCTEGLLGSPNAVVYGHHMNDGTMFAELANYTDQAWAAEHATVLVQTPTEKRAYKVRFADTVSNWTLPKRVEFLDKTDFDSWYSDGLSSAAAVVDGEEEAEQTISLVTCSFWWYTDERTVATCSEDFEDLDTVVSDGSKALGAQGRRAAVHERVWGEIEAAKKAEMETAAASEAMAEDAGTDEDDDEPTAVTQ